MRSSFHHQTCQKTSSRPLYTDFPPSDGMTASTSVMRSSGNSSWTSSVDLPPSDGTTGSTSGNCKRSRGPNKLTNLQNIINASEPIDLEISPTTFKPKSQVAAMYLPKVITYIIRTMAPQMRKEKWRDISESEKKPLYAHLQMYFKINDFHEEHVRKSLEQYFRDSYRRFRNKCHHHYCKQREQGDNPLLNPLEGIKQSDWKFLCSYFESEKFQHKSIVNTENRKRLKYTHCMGPKPFVVALAEKEKANPSQQINTIEWFAETRTNKKTKKFCDPAAEEAYVDNQNFHSSFNFGLENYNCSFHVARKLKSKIRRMWKSIDVLGYILLSLDVEI